MNKTITPRGVHSVMLLLATLMLAMPAYTAPDYYALPALPQQQPTRAPLTAITNAGTRLVAVGERGVIIYSDDGGAQWQQAEVPVSHALTAVSFANDEHGWAVGHSGVILHSSDSGATWKVQFDGNDANKAWLKFAQRRATTLQQQVDAAAPEEGEEKEDDTQQAAAPDVEEPDLALQLEDAQYAVEDAEEALKGGPNDPFLDVHFSDVNNGYAVGAYGMLYHTTDGGLKWQLQAGNIDNVDRYHYYSVATDADGSVYLSGETGILYRSDDGGEQWQTLPTPYDGSLFGITVAADQSILTYGLRGNIFRSEDQGNSWQTVPHDSEASLYGGTRLASDHIILVGAAGTMLESHDNGQTFSGETHSSRSTFSAVAANAAQDLLIAGMNGVVIIPAAKREQ